MGATLNAWNGKRPPDYDRASFVLATPPFKNGPNWRFKIALICFFCKLKWTHKMGEPISAVGAIFKGGVARSKDAPPPYLFGWDELLISVRRIVHSMHRPFECNLKNFKAYSMYFKPDLTDEIASVDINQTFGLKVVIVDLCTDERSVQKLINNFTC